MNTLIHCIDCNCIYAITPVDRALEFEKSDEELGYYAIGRNDKEEFENKHKGHKKEELTIIGESICSIGKYFDPQKIMYFYATNGEDNFLIKKWRKSIDEPFQYDLINGVLEVKKSIEIQKNSIKKQLAYEINNPSLAEETIAKFIEILQGRASTINPDDNFNNLYETDDAQIFYLPLSAQNIEDMLEECKKNFHKEEFKKIELFIKNNCAWDGVLSLIVTKRPVIHSNLSSAHIETCRILSAS